MNHIITKFALFISISILFFNLQLNTAFLKQYLQTSRDCIAYKYKVFSQIRFQDLEMTRSGLVTATTHCDQWLFC